MTPYESFIGFRLVGWGIILAFGAALLTHIGFSYATLPEGRILPDPLLRIYFAGAHRARHGGDTGTFDCEGRFRPQQFADFFAKYGKQMDDGQWGITFGQTLEGINAMKCIADPFGVIAGILECPSSTPLCR